jgi:predicted secreted Zn-dependent protease
MRQVPVQGTSGKPVAKRWIALALGLASLTACTTSNSGLTTVYYKVPGTTVEQINEQIARLGPQNGHAIGTTETRMTPRVKTVRENGACRIEQANVSLDLIVTLPHWSELSKADGETRAAFERLGAHVEWHEQQHVEISQRYANRIETALTEIPPQKTCREVMNKARARFKAMFEEHNKAQRDFDATERRAIERRLRSLGLAA